LKHVNNVLADEFAIGGDFAYNFEVAKDEAFTDIIVSGSKQDDGSIQFASIEITESGTYTFFVRELQTTVIPDGYDGYVLIHDTAVYRTKETAI
jgi:hypothetical protein